MTQYLNSDQTLADLASSVLKQYHEPVTGSKAIDLDIVYDTLNSVYLDIFNEPVDLSYYREKSYTFQTVQDVFVQGPVVAGMNSITVNDSSAFPNAPRTILLGGTDFATYTSNNLFTNTLLGVSGVDVNQIDSTTVQLGYPLASIANLDEEQIDSVWIQGIKFTYEQPELFFSTNRPHYLRFSVFEDNLYLPSGTAPQIGTMIYMKKIVPMTSTTDKPFGIPNKWRYGLLVHGTVARIGVRDDLRTSWDWHQNEFKENKKKFFAAGGNRVKTKGPLMRPSVFD